MARVQGFDDIETHGRYTIIELETKTNIAESAIRKAIDSGKLKAEREGPGHKWYIAGWAVFMWRGMIPPAQPLAQQILAIQEVGVVPTSWNQIHPWRYYSLADLAHAGGGVGPSETTLRKAVAAGKLKCNRQLDNQIRIMGIQYLISINVFPV